MKEKIVLAFSGGLDTSFCAMYLSREKGYEVHTALANTGGFGREELDRIEERAYRLGAKSHTNIDVTEEYYEKGVRYMIFGNVLRGNYPISVSSERIFQAMAIIRHAKEIGAGFVAHGSTGAGNDQVRFDLTFDVLAPDIKIITPVRDLSLSREYEISYLEKHGYKADFTQMAYSINKGLWGTSIGGRETLESDRALPDGAYPTALSAEGEEILKIGFTEGEVTSVNGNVFTDKIAAINKINEIGSRYAIGRGLHTGDTIIGIKGRIGFEAPAPHLIISAHRMLERHTLGKWQQYWKDQIGTWYGMFLHEAQYLDPVMRDMEAFLLHSQRYVTGEVELRLYPYGYETVGIRSCHDLMNSDFGQYGETGKAWSPEDVKGFTKITAIPAGIFYSVNKL